MNQIAHIIRKDLRHLRILLLVWLALMILQAVLTGGAHTWKPTLLERGLVDNIRGIHLLANLVAILSLLKFLLLTMIVSQLVQADSLVGNNAFWLTLPVSRGGLLASKSLFLVSDRDSANPAS